LWRADRLAPSSPTAAQGDAVRPTGHAALDAELPGGGWPGAGLIELLLPAPGCGELRLLAPALTGATTGSPALTGATGSPALLWVAPPLVPYAPALSALGFALDRITLAAPARAADAAWAAEQALRSGALGAVLWWQASEPVAPATLRRLHLAAQGGHTPLFAFRPLAVRAQSSPAPLRLALEPAADPGALSVDVFKRRGPPMATPLRLALGAPAASKRRRPAAVDNNHAVVRPAPERVAA
jgi:protein ImuA